MIAAWLVYAMVVATLIAVATWGADAVCRRLALPARWVWIGALGLTTGVVLLAPLRPRVTTLRGNVTVPVATAMAAIEREAPEAMNRWLAIGWVAASSGLFALVLLVHHRVRRVSRAWPVAQLHGVPVRLSPSIGPMVTGVVLPEIVVPQWLLGRTVEEQHLVLAHESQHLQARDPLLLAAGWLTAVLLPAIPPVWWMLSRLRLAVEVDCDQRVLGCGRTDVRSYGALLIALQGEHAGLPMPLPGFAARSSQLHQRLVAMTASRKDNSLLRALPFATLAVVALVVACNARLPTASAPRTGGNQGGLIDSTLVAGVVSPGKLTERERTITRDQADDLVRRRIDSTLSAVVSSVMARAIPDTRLNSADPDPHDE